MSLLIPEPVPQPNLLSPNVDSEGNLNEVLRRFLNSVWIAFNAESQVIACVQEQFPDLSNVHNQTILFVSDYGHFIYWSGTNAYFCGDNPGQLVKFQFPPVGVGWHLCDGSVGVPYMNPNGTLSFTTLPVIANTYFRQ